MTKRWRHWLSAAVIFGVVAILAVIAVPCENLRVVVVNDSNEPAAIQVIAWRNNTNPTHVVWAGTAKGGETREIPLFITAGDYELDLLARFRDIRKPGVMKDLEYSGGGYWWGYLFGRDMSCFRLTDEGIRPERCSPPPSSSTPEWVEFVLLPLRLAAALYRVTSCRDYELRQTFRRWIADLPFRSKSAGGSG